MNKLKSAKTIETLCNAAIKIRPLDPGTYKKIAYLIQDELITMEKHQTRENLINLKALFREIDKYIHETRKSNDEGLKEFLESLNAYFIVLTRHQENLAIKNEMEELMKTLEK